MGPNSGRVAPGGTVHRGIELQAGTPGKPAAARGGPGRSPVLTSASLQPIANLTVPPSKAIHSPCSPTAAPTDAQTYTVTSSNPNIAASIAKGPFWNVGVSYTDPPTPRTTSPAP